MKTKKAKSTNGVEHPSYPYPTIVEALCEIHFERAEGEAWKPSLPGELFKQIQKDFPEMEPGVELGVQVELGPEKFGHSFLPPRQRMKYKHATRPLLLQLAENVFTVNVLPTYPGWETMRVDVLKAWSQAKKVLSPARITRLGLRYINRIERTDPKETPDEWLRSGDYLPAGVLKSKGAFLSRVESHIDKENRVVVTLAELSTDNPDTPRPIVFDIDRMVEKEIAVNDTDLLAEMETLHEHVWEIFDGAKTPRLSKHLKGVAK